MDMISARPHPAAPADPAVQVRSYFIASLGFALTFGAILGTLVLGTKTLPWNLLGGVPLAAARAAHGYAQVFGFAALFIMGVALHVVPRMKGEPLAAVRWTRPALQMQVAGVALAVLGALATNGPLSLAGGLLLLAGAALFGAVVHRTLAQGAPTPQWLEPYLRAGCLWLVAAACLACAAAVADPLQGAVWEAALWGFGASWIFGMSLRILPAHLGLGAVPATHARALWIGYQAAAVLWVGAAVAEAFAPLAGVRLVTGAALALAGMAFALRLAWLRPAPGSTVDSADFRAFIRAAYGWLLVALVFAPGADAAGCLAGAEPSALGRDFGRHAFTIGFLSQVIMGVSLRVVPIFAGGRLWSQALQRVLLVLLNLAVVLRGLQVAVDLGLEKLWPLVSLAGPVALAAFAVFALELVMSLRPRRKPPVSFPALPC